MESKLHPFFTLKDMSVVTKSLNGLPRGIIESRSDLELKSLWRTRSFKSKVNITNCHNLLAMAVGVRQKENVNTIVRKFLSKNFTIILFHYDGNLDGWWDLEWSREAIHIVAHNQTKWWFAKRFLHPDVVVIYDYIFLWDEDLGVENFDPGRYLEIVKSIGLEISQPALDPNSTGIHHRITIRKRTKKFHRRIYVNRDNRKCSGDSEGPPCTGFVEGMAPVFSRTAWHCAWHLIQNDLVHGWGIDMKLGYCAQGDPTKKVGVVDSEYIVHQSIQTLGGVSARKVMRLNISDLSVLLQLYSTKRVLFYVFLFTMSYIQRHAMDVRSEVRCALRIGIVQIRRQSTIELQRFEERWEQAAKEDKKWVDPFASARRRSRKLKPFQTWT
ncbi:hypothetical protein F511_03036 [Dorcoceras hygrometricum]|nr:hypothetical protein F511_03036 [Dorcoceras hygrometricum]